MCCHVEVTEGNVHHTTDSPIIKGHPRRQRTLPHLSTPPHLTSPIIRLDKRHRRHDRFAHFIPNVDVDFRALFVPPRCYVCHGDVLS